MTWVAVMVVLSVVPSTTTGSPAVTALTVAALVPFVDLPQPFGVGVDDHRIGGLERDPSSCVHDAGPGDGFGGEAGQVDGPPIQRPSGFVSGQQQEVCHQPAHPVGLAGDQRHQPQQFFPAGRVVLLQAVLGQPADRGQRGAQFVAGVRDEAAHAFLGPQGTRLAVRSRQVGGLDAGQHHIQRFGQPPDLGVSGRLVDAPGQVTGRDRRGRRLDPGQRRQAGPHQRQAEAGQQNDADGSGHRVGYLQAGDRTVETAETVGNDEMTSAG